MRPVDSNIPSRIPKFETPKLELNQIREKELASVAPKDQVSVRGKSEDCDLGCHIKKGIDAVLEPIKRGAIKAKKLGKLVASGFVTAIKVAPTLATLLAASAAAKVEGMIPGREKLSAIEWLQARAPNLFNSTLTNAADLIGDSTVNSTGMSVDELIEIEQHIYKSLSPELNLLDGRKTPALFIKQLGQAPFRQPGAPHAAYVYLGDGRQDESKEVMTLWNAPEPPTSNPYEKEQDLHQVWSVLEEMAAEKKLPVFIDLDGDARTFTSTEYISKEIMKSMVTRHNDTGDGFQDPGLYYSWLTTRQESYYNVLDPWMAESNPPLHSRIGRLKDNLTPPWLGSPEGLGPWPSPRRVDRAFAEVETLANASTKSTHGLTDFADTVVALDQDIMTGTMTHWIKLLKEAGGDKRSKILGNLARAWTNLHVGSASKPELAVPKGSPVLKALEGPPPELTSHQYDRAISLGEVVDHTLDGLGVFERKEFMADVKGEMKKNLTFLQGQDQRFAQQLGDKYDGIDFAPLLASSEAGDDPELKRRLEQLRSVLHEDNGLSEKELKELHRHHSIADWLVNSQKRYGDVHFGLIGHAKAFQKDPLGVSQFFDQMQSPTSVTMLGNGPSRILDKQGTDGPPTMKVTIIREGGGGKGMAYPTPSRALKTGLKSLDFQYDDVGGNSAGVIPSLLEAAGFNSDEIEDISSKLDFKEFNADAIPLMGATDPKIGGINQTGLFSSQKMYKDLYEILSKKLNIEGRPILFRDLPKRIAMTSTIMNTDLPKSDPLWKLIDSDKRLVMNPEDTPNFDVIGAVTASTAVPAYFNAPQMHVARSVEKDGEIETKLYRMQFVDGGVVDNFPLSAAKKDETGKTALVLVPAYYETIDPETGKKISLSTLNFDDTHVAAVNRQNSTYYAEMMPKLDSFLKKAAEDGYSRVVIGMNLSSLDEQKLPVIQGRSKAETAHLLELADQSELGHMSATDGGEFVRGTIHSPSLVKKAAGAAFNLFIDGQTGENNEYSWGIGGSSARVGQSEEENVLQVIRGVGSSNLALSQDIVNRRLFET